MATVQTHYFGKAESLASLDGTLQRAAEHVGKSSDLFSRSFSRRLTMRFGESNGAALLQLLSSTKYTLATRVGIYGRR